jgi:hypothetical protein
MLYAPHMLEIAVSDLLVPPAFELRDLLWRILVTIVLLLILAGPDARVLSQVARSSDSAIAPVVQGF